MDGALLIHKPAGPSSFGVIESLQRAVLRNPASVGLVGPYGSKQDQALPRKRDLPKMGHGGTLDPFATGLLAVCVGNGVKLARYFLGSRKTYEGIIRFGEATSSGDPTTEIIEQGGSLPASLAEIQAKAHEFTLAPYHQTPPMHSAIKKDGKPLYELARQGIEIERPARELKIFSFEILSYEAPHAQFRVSCSSGTYVRTLAQDLARKLGTVALLDSLHRTASGSHALSDGAMSLDEIVAATEQGRPWDELSAWVPFDRLLDGYARAEATADEALAIVQGKQAVLPRILARTTEAVGADAPVAIYQGARLVAIARQSPSELGSAWGLERVFTQD